MPIRPAEAHCAEIAAATAALADRADPDLPIPACPEWTLRHLATRVGRAHRRAAEIARTRSAGFIESRAVPDGNVRVFGNHDLLGRRLQQAAF